MNIVELTPKHPVAKWIWHVVWDPIMFVLAFAPLLLLNVLQLAGLVLLPFSLPAFRAYNRALAFGIWGWWAIGMDKLVGLQVRVTGDSLPERENAIVVANHQGMADILVLLCLAHDRKSVGNVKWLVKDIIKYVPGIGWGMLFVQCIFLKRNWADDKNTITETFRSITEEGTPIWLISFPEGTRFRPEKLTRSNNYARKIGVPETTHVLQPRTKGFCATVEGLGAHVDAIYSACIGYHGPVPGLWNLIRGDVPMVSIHVRRLPPESVGTTQKEREAWLHQNTYRHDEMLANFAKTHRFDPRTEDTSA